MGDPISVATGTAGLVSLGLQVSSGLITYCKAWKSYDRNIDTTLER